MLKSSAKFFLKSIGLFNCAKYIYNALKKKPVKRVFNAETFNSYPEELFITLATTCNLRCKFCNRDGFKSEILPLERVYSLQNPIKKAKFIDITGWGEPFLHPEINTILKYITKTCKNKRCINVTTNGTRLDSEHGQLMRGHLHGLVVSLNAATAPTYALVTENGQLDKTLTALQNCLNELDQEDRKRITFSFVAAQYNYEELPEFISLAHSMGVPSVSVVPVLLRPSEFAGRTLFEIKDAYNEVIDRTFEQGKKLGILVSARQFGAESITNFDPGSNCLWPFTTCIIQMSGKMAVCCFAGDSSAIEGNAYVDFEKMWFSDQLKRLRAKRYYKACRSCLPFASFDDPALHTIKE